MIRKRRGVLLIEMITVILMVGVGGTLMAVGLVTMLRSQKRVVEFGNQFAATNDFLRCFSRDVRTGTTAAMQEPVGGDVRRVLMINTVSGQVVYRFDKQQVQREASPGVAAKLWSPMTAEVAIVSGPNVSGGVGINLSVSWFRGVAKDPGPNRRFDLFVRCGGELGYEEK